MDPNVSRWSRCDARSVRRLAVCRSCARDFVVALDGEEHGDKHWRLILRCGGCEAVAAVIASEAEVDAYCDDFAQATQRLEADMLRLARERMADEIACLVVALRLDLIGSDDFTR